MATAIAVKCLVTDASANTVSSVTGSSEFEASDAETCAAHHAIALHDHDGGTDDALLLPTGFEPSEERIDALLDRCNARSRGLGVLRRRRKRRNADQQ